ncbi:GDYXXLXY domain-containing protein [Peribacillus sp. TH16]|uniref:GDYXXLXY domain-containing protein n=1 Tax=unclassified Peribacillus TaxID=2675266 RepID=UPI0019129269|nr:MULTISPECIES: GDYXXLXY domain-containing protein [unclassified Peribacillus]MBK5482204.1 GDYXXLXY domain-containing protein [Peribacillus sp. TH16]WMX56306.1 GDYXXLXY domain-containing protein [Peribacillus sp. R9-11]
MKNNLFFRPLIVFSIPILILLVLAIPPVWTTMTGEEIKIKTAPVDPTDLFRGSYVALNYEIETVKPSQLDDSVISEFKTRNMGDYKKVYVRLKQSSDGLYKVDLVTKEKPSKGVYLKGELEIPYDLKRATTVQIRYGLDNYYASEEKAKEMETDALAKPSVAIVKVRNGNVVLTDIIIE